MINFTPLNDMVLVKPDLPAEKIGMLYVPEIAKQYGTDAGRAEDTFVGTVVAVGPGDPHKPFHLVRCPECGSFPTFYPALEAFTCGCLVPVPSQDEQAPRMTSLQQAEEWNQGRYPMELKIGDRVVYPRRPSQPGGEFFTEIDGEKYQMFHEEQFAYALIESN